MGSSSCGSELLLPLSELLRLPIEQVNFGMCQLFGIFAAFLFRSYLHPSRTSHVIRHVVVTFLGLHFAFFCFGRYAIHFLGEVTLLYCVMVTVHVKSIHKYSFLVAMTYLTICQIIRVYVFDGKERSADFSGPLMVITQKVTKLAFELHDGLARDENELTPSQKRLAVRRIPSLLEYFSYNLNFMGILAGPLNSFNDYITFIEGRNFEIRTNHLANGQKSNKPGQHDPSPLTDVKDPVALFKEEQGEFSPVFWPIFIPQPTSLKTDYPLIHLVAVCGILLCVNWLPHFLHYNSDYTSKRAVGCKVLICAVCAFMHLTLLEVFPISYNTDETFILTGSIPGRLFYLYISLLACRPKYYFAWTIADAVNNAAGFGFTGYDSRGKPRWDLVSNLNIVKIEFATSMKMFIDNWNIQTALWLKQVCYDRCPFNPTLVTFLLSAIWHGVYPGYYFTFIAGMFMTLAARAVRNNLRPHFLVSPTRKAFYDIVTWATTQVVVSYTVTPFVLPFVDPSLEFYRTWYFSFHIIAIVLILVLPKKPRCTLKERQSRPETKNTEIIHHCNGQQNGRAHVDNNQNHRKKID